MRYNETIKTIALALLLTVLATVALYIVAYVDTNYERKDCEVVESKGGYTTAEDKQGHLWTFKGDYFKIGDRIDLRMNTNGTKSIYDDTVTQAHRAGE